MILFLRWVVGLASAIALVGFALVLTVGKGLELTYRSGAGAASLVRDLMTAGVPVLLLAMLVSVFLPQERTFLCVVAVLVAAAMAGCLTILATNPGEGSLYLGFFGLWALYFGMTIWGRG
ncbi:hypothetical protein [Paludibaculum fermentans]|uniref:Uncharacterized protein n=1 Tax=Paludibaculum fermentans TaxID=1473598 RepID=A0A7S7NQQ7_PALFE|nr:hypothetical protein [Paludibaculum fermentans]QOY88051.1 hypothetical protein IRI77_35840 [Paludibaculum fermentans]